MGIDRVNVNEDGTLDEIVGTGLFHLEQMDDDCWYLELGGLSFTLGVKDGCKRKVIALPLDFGYSEKSWRDWRDGLPEDAD